MYGLAKHSVSKTRELHNWSNSRPMHTQEAQSPTNRHETLKVPEVSSQPVVVRLSVRNLPGCAMQLSATQSLRASKCWVLQN